MLLALHITNLALVEQLELDLHPGFTVISGGTGAGKSLMIAALGMALGDRPKHLSGDNCQIIAEFSVAPNTPPARWLHSQELAQKKSEPIQAIVRRTITNKRSKAFINGTVVSVQELQQFGDLIVNLHSQHQHHALLQRSYQRELLDNHAEANELATSVARLHSECNQLKRALDDSANQQQLAEREAELLAHQLSELAALGPQDGEYQQLNAAHNRAGKARSLQLLLLRVQTELEGNGQYPGILERLGKSVSELRALRVDETDDIARIVENASELLAEAKHQAQNQANQELDQQAFATIDDRVSLYHQIARKHQCKAEELARLHSSLQQQFEQLTDRLSNPTKLLEELKQSTQLLATKANQLTQKRTLAAAELTARINQLLPQLAMPDASFKIALESLSEPSAEGFEYPEFLLATNAGGPTMALKSIASGGELSRCSLATYLACAHNTHSMTMVFDEVDTGLGASEAATVGSVLKQLACHHQVLCITHQPQIVAHANQHLLVHKNRANGQASITVEPLDEEASIAEIATMLAGDDSNQVNTSSHTLAREMYQLGRGS